ncbi:MAG: multicopper oxidase domain-containing protein, partial [Gemmatimonadota bacterium]|nr:multicopper oxidase domain-containing protein [Gemmatimonadota bacterium]
MMGTQMLAALITTAALTATGEVANYATRTRKVARTNFDKVITATTPMYDAALPPISDAGIKEFRIPIRDAKVEIANGVKYQGRTFDGTVPGPVIHVRQGDLARITVVNDAGMPPS